MSTSLSDNLGLKLLKEFVTKKLPPTSTVRELILSEPDELPKDEFVAKFKVWATLLNKELTRQPHYWVVCR